ncbi:MAG: tetraacyldisaccharide 4'-kinase [Gammaproteobacteria bacterium]|nr:tetraacyldisaccharide 4'-kinase [Gammaproteobacteria bacterium]
MKSLDHYWYNKNLLAWLLWPLSLLFCLLVWCRRWAYKSAVFKSYKAAKPVIIIGNISVGGTGKTPLIIALSGLLNSWGYKVGIISRGYGGHADWPYQLTASSQAAACGDEPVQLFQRTGLPIVVGPDRLADAQLLCQQNNIDIILADDGLQHYRLQRDLELVVIDNERGFGNGFCLPAGPLREPVSRLGKDSWRIYNGGDQAYSFQIRPLSVKHLKSGDSQSLDDFKADTVHAVAGIGNPQRFFTMLRSMGLTIIEHAFADHHQFSDDDLSFDDAFAVLMTEKDSVKCQATDNDKLWFVTIDIVLTEQFVNDLKTQVGKLTNG